MMHGNPQAPAMDWPVVESLIPESSMMQNARLVTYACTGAFSFIDARHYSIPAERTTTNINKRIHTYVIEP